MNRQRIERIRQAAQQDVDNLRGLGGDECAGPATPMEAYRRAGWFASTWVVGLCDALLAEEEIGSGPDPSRSRSVARGPAEAAAPAVLTCIVCGRTIPPGELANYGWAWTARRFSGFGVKCSGRCYPELENWSA